MSVPLSKIEVASRQLNAAIHMFFAGGDSIAVHTLAAAAANVFADILEHSSGVSWRTRARDDSGLTMSELKALLHEEWNFFKHADRDPDSVLHFNEELAADLMFMATLDCGDLTATSCEMRAFQIWYMAAAKFWVPSDHEPFRLAREALPGISSLPRPEQISRGAAFLAVQCGNAPPAIFVS
jgi:hypothetical protein